MPAAIRRQVFLLHLLTHPPRNPGRDSFSHTPARFPRLGGVAQPLFTIRVGWGPAIPGENLGKGNRPGTASQPFLRGFKGYRVSCRITT